MDYRDNYSDRNCDRAVFGVTKGINYIEEEEKSLKAQKVMGQQGKQRKRSNKLVKLKLFLQCIGWYIKSEIL